MEKPHRMQDQCLWTFIRFYGCSICLSNMQDYSKNKISQIYTMKPREKCLFNTYRRAKNREKNVSALYDKNRILCDSRDLVGLGYKEGTVGKT